MRAIVFAGPSLPPNARPASPAIDWRPPVRQGECYRAALERPAIIGIIDGYFEATPTVWHKEILWAMTQGIHVCGAASIGALRAAELAPFGMRGIGRIFEDFRTGVLEDDDEVALLHGPAELDYPPLTEAMVNIRATLAAATRDGVIGTPLAEELVGLARTQFYKERTYTAMFEAAGAAGLDKEAVARLGDWLPAGRIDQKRADALEMLDAIDVCVVAREPPLRVDYKFADTAAWQAVKRAARDPTNA
jgi:hypothetical protein